MLRAKFSWAIFLLTDCLSEVAMVLGKWGDESGTVWNQFVENEFVECSLKKSEMQFEEFFPQTGFYKPADF